MKKESNKLMINLFKKDNKKLINILRITREKNIKAKPWCLKKCYFKLNKTFKKIQIYYTKNRQISLQESKLEKYKLI